MPASSSPTLPTISSIGCRVNKCLGLDRFPFRQSVGVVSITPRGRHLWLATAFDPSPKRGGLPPRASADVQIRLGDSAARSHPFDAPARAVQELDQVIDGQHPLQVGGQRSTGLGGLGLVVDGIGQVRDRTRRACGGRRVSSVSCCFSFERPRTNENMIVISELESPRHRDDQDMPVMVVIKSSS